MSTQFVNERGQSEAGRMEWQHDEPYVPPATQLVAHNSAEAPADWAKYSGHASGPGQAGNPEPAPMPAPVPQQQPAPVATYVTIHTPTHIIDVSGDAIIHITRK